MAINLFTERMDVLWLLIGEMTYTYYVVLRLRKGVPRMLALLPLLPPSLLLPWRQTTAPERTLYCFLFLWVIMSKLLLLAWDSGPASDPSVVSSFPRFFAAMAFSLHLKRNDRFNSTKKLEPAAMNATAAVDDDRDAKMKAGGGNSDVANGLVNRKKLGAVAPASTVKNGKSNGVQVDELLLHGRPNKAASTSYPGWLDTFVNSQAGQIVVLRSVYLFIVAATLIRIAQQWKHVMPLYILDLVLAFVLYFSALFLFESVAGVTSCILGSQLHPQFNMPFLADSLADFWGRRWNLLVSNLLRVSVYDVMLDFIIIGDEKKRKPTPRDRVIPAFASFFVSGVMHELIFYYMNKTRPTGEMTAFFVLQGIAVILEGLVKPKERFGMPRFLCRAYTLGFIYLTACWLFFPPLLRTGMVDQCLVDLQTFVDWVVGMIVRPVTAVLS